jgi:hypothetical protein
MARREDTLFMETTKISATRSAGEVSDVLVQAGASQISMMYKNAKIIGLRWVLNVDGRDLLFSMPARIDPVFGILKQRAERGPYSCTRRLSAAELIELRDKAERVAWRQLLRWVQAQLAMVQTGMVKAQEVFLPYWQEGDKTLYEFLSETKFKMLPAASSDSDGSQQ